MSFLARIFGKKTPAKAAEKKSPNLESLSLDALVNIIQSGGDESLRLAAIQKITDQTILLKLAGINEVANVSASIQKAAKQRLINLVEADALNGDELCSSVVNKIELFALINNNNALFEKMFGSIVDEAELANFALEGSTSKLRQRAAEKITNKSILQQLLKETKTKDKTVFKIVKEKCDAFKEEDKRQAEIFAAVNAAAHALEQHSNRPYDGQYGAKFSYLLQQWDTQKTDATIDMSGRAEAAIAKCEQTIKSISSEQAAEEAKRKAEENCAAERAAHIQQLQELLLTIVTSEVNVDETQTLLRLLAASWDELNSLKKASLSEQKMVDALRRIISDELSHRQVHGSLAAHQSRFQQLVAEASQEAQETYQSLKKRVTLLVGSFKENLPETVAAAQAAYQSWEKVAADKAAELQNTQRHIAGLIRKANETVSAGVLGKAMGIRRAIDEKIQSLEHLPNHLVSQLQQLDETLAKLQDWKNYAVVPKKQELIAQLEALQGSNEHPESLANKIKRIQDEWRSLSKGAKDQDQDLWEKFHELAQQVYQPCRDYFAEQAALRQQNLESCKQLVTQLQDYVKNYDWQNALWKDVEQVIRVARQEWRNYTPTERAATQPVLAEFESVLAVIQQKLHDEFAKNAQLKKELIAQVQALVNSDDSRKATDAVKQLQTRWQSIGTSLRKEEQQLWREFRDQCDAVFAKRQQQSAEFKAELDANLASAKALIVQVEELTALSGQALQEARKAVDDLRQAFGNLGQFPKAQVNDIKNAFNQAIDSFEKKLKDERTQLKQQVWVNLFTANNEVRLYELALKKTESLSADAVQEKINAISQWPAGGSKAIQQKLARASAAANLSENLAALRELCIRAEILTDSPTLASDQTLRTAFQVNQLQQNFGRKTQDVATEFEHLVFEWIAIGAVETADYDALFARFNTCRLKATH